jgi:hypothetical protein
VEAIPWALEASPGGALPLAKGSGCTRLVGPLGLAMAPICNWGTVCACSTAAGGRPMGDEGWPAWKDSALARLRWASFSLRPLWLEPALRAGTLVLTQNELFRVSICRWGREQGDGAGSRMAGAVQAGVMFLVQWCQTSQCVHPLHHNRSTHTLRAPC